VSGSINEYYVMVTMAYCIPVILWAIEKSSPWGILTCLSFPYALYWMVFIKRHSGKALNKALAGTGKVVLIYALLYALGMVFSVFSKTP
jgi:1,4-dihydroxy-2-naphthoate octaprenyltransferase